ncbi:accessory gene regulator B family protein [Enterococcus sp. MSG2901]|uniref:Accessory gene regulator B family protein n=2 Tax=Candidatus Enterococcus courvalinii TaxID=2815329 RepID=A0ABS3I0E8_9ENTE|nr:accessory gene regulator B family protein [Enterococcus sp. MSG2901]
MADQSLISSEEISLFEYGIEQAIKYLLLYILGLITAVFFNLIISYLYFCIMLISTKSYLGGKHFHNETWCMISSVLFVILTLEVAQLITKISTNYDMLFAFCVIQIMITISSKVIIHSNQPLTRREIELNKRKSNILLIIQLLILFLCWITNFDVLLPISCSYFFLYHLTRIN